MVILFKKRLSKGHILSKKSIFFFKFAEDGHILTKWLKKRYFLNKNDTFFNVNKFPKTHPLLWFFNLKFGLLSRISKQETGWISVKISTFWGCFPVSNLPWPPLGINGFYCIFKKQFSILPTYCPNLFLFWLFFNFLFKFHCLPFLLSFTTPQN